MVWTSRESVVTCTKTQHEATCKQEYDKWGEGLKHIDELEDRMVTKALEMSKPLATHIDDKDLEAHYIMANSDNGMLWAKSTRYPYLNIFSNNICDSFQIP